MPRQGRSRETVEAIVEAAAQVFERHGYAAGTTNRIADRAGLSIGSLYQYFPNKDAIVVELARRHITDIGEVAWPALEALAREMPPLREALAAIVFGTIELHARSPELHRVLFEETPRSDEIQALMWELFDRSSRLIGDYLAACPEVSVRDPYLAARMVAQVVDQVSHGAVIHPRDGEAPEVYARETITMLERYLTELG
ncbi:MAG TPA: TetR/AcrR family transcriptional regulator [Solirubrobacterales bacterium]|nr:TetR/AcrR family transcriptional regulator [Solirubrobacterales bacterium]